MSCHYGRPLSGCQRGRNRNADRDGFSGSALADGAYWASPVRTQ